MCAMRHEDFAKIHAAVIAGKSLLTACGGNNPDGRKTAMQYRRLAARYARTGEQPAPMANTGAVAPMANIGPFDPEKTYQLFLQQMHNGLVRGNKEWAKIAWEYFQKVRPEFQQKKVSITAMKNEYALLWEEITGGVDKEQAEKDREEWIATHPKDDPDLSKLSNHLDKPHAL